MSLQPIVSRDDLSLIGRFLVKELQREIAIQEHVATGTLQDSFEFKITNKGNTVSLEIWSENYGEYVERGRKAGARRVPIAALIEWIKVRAIASGDKEIKSIAFAIQEKIFREGIPTNNSRTLAPRRLNHLQFVIEKSQGHITQVMDKRIQDNMRRQLDAAFDQANKELKIAA